MKNYHIHIYYDLTQKNSANVLVTELLALNLEDLKFHKDYGHKVGPHALPMIELHLTEASLKRALKCLRENGYGLSVLVHEDSGDDFKDHESPIWVGQPLPLDFEFFNKVKANRSLSVH